MAFRNDRDPKITPTQFRSAPLVVKTIRILDNAALVRALNTTRLEAARFVVLFRDPREQLVSIRKYTAFWKKLKKSISLYCKMLALQVLSLPDLAAAVASEHILVEVYEQWMQDEKAFSKRLANFAQVTPASAAFVEAAQSAHPFNRTLVWPAQLPNSDLVELEADEHCRAYMQRVGYKSGSTDLSELRNKTQILAPLSEKQADLLASLRDLQRA